MSTSPSPSTITAEEWWECPKGHISKGRPPTFRMTNFYVRDLITNELRSIDTDTQVCWACIVLALKARFPIHPGKDDPK